MINFEKINKMIDLIEESQIIEGMTFNEFAMEFYSEVKLVPLSRYLKTNNRVKRMPKIMNMRKAGELLLFTKTDDETLSFLKRKKLLQTDDKNHQFATAPFKYYLLNFLIAFIISLFLIATEQVLINFSKSSLFKFNSSLI